MDKNVKMIPIPTDLLESLIDAAWEYCDQGPPGEGWKSPALEKTISDAEHLLSEYKHD